MSRGRVRKGSAFCFCKLGGSPSPSAQLGCLATYENWAYQPSGLPEPSRPFSARTEIASAEGASWNEVNRPWRQQITIETEDRSGQNSARPSAS
jgi:hypothetical protein